MFYVLNYFKSLPVFLQHTFPKTKLGLRFLPAKFVNNRIKWNCCWTGGCTGTAGVGTTSLRSFFFKLFIFVLWICEARYPVTVVKIWQQQSLWSQANGRCISQQLAKTPKLWQLWTECIAFWVNDYLIEKGIRMNPCFEEKIDKKQTCDNTLRFPV